MTQQCERKRNVLILLLREHRYIPPNDDSPAAQQLSKLSHTLDSPAPLTIKTEILSRKKPAKSVQSPSHSITVEKGDGKATADGLFSVKAELKSKVSRAEGQNRVMCENVPIC